MEEKYLNALISICQKAVKNKDKYCIGVDINERGESRKEICDYLQKGEMISDVEIFGKSSVRCQLCELGEIKAKEFLGDIYMK